MNRQSLSQLRRSAARIRNLVTLRLFGLRAATVMTVGEAPRPLVTAAIRIRRKASLKPVIAFTVLLALAISPTFLYRSERSRYEEQKRAYRNLQLQSATETGFLESSLQELLAEQAVLRSMLLDAGRTVADGGKVTAKVIATGYSSSVMETDDTPFITAANTQTRWGIIAMSRDLLRNYTPGAPFAFGDHVHIPGLGDFLVEDSMNARWTNRVDVWFPSRVEALKFGMREVYVTKITENEIVDSQTSRQGVELMSEGLPPSGAGF